jgi:hypothetical protein
MIKIFWAACIGVIGPVGGFLFGLLGLSANGIIGSLITAVVGATVLIPEGLKRSDMIFYILRADSTRIARISNVNPICP